MLILSISILALATITFVLYRNNKKKTESFSLPNENEEITQKYDNLSFVLAQERARVKADRKKSRKWSEVRRSEPPVSYNNDDSIANTFLAASLLSSSPEPVVPNTVQDTFTSSSCDSDSSDSF